MLTIPRIHYLWYNIYTGIYVHIIRRLTLFGCLVAAALSLLHVPAAATVFLLLLSRLNIVRSNCIYIIIVNVIRIELLKQKIYSYLFFMYTYITWLGWMKSVSKNRFGGTVYAI